MIPLVMGVFYLPDSFLPLLWQNIIACVIFVIAAVTDALDGYLARRYEAGPRAWAPSSIRLPTSFSYPPRSFRSSNSTAATWPLQ